MSIVSTVVVRDETTSGIRSVWWRCTDHLGQTHDYGPMLTVDPSFDPLAFVPVVEQKVAAKIAAREANQLLGEE